MISSSNNAVRRCRPLLGTFVEVAAWGDPAILNLAVDAAFGAVERVQGLMSFHDPATELSRLNRGGFGESIAVDGETHRVISFAKEVAAASNGAFDPTVASVLQGWGILPSSAARQEASGNWQDLEILTDFRIRFARPLTLDLGGIAKGFAVDRAVETLLTLGVESGLVNAGGDLRAFGPREHRLHIRDPRFPSRLIDGFRLHNAAMATSAPTFSRHKASGTPVSHLVDPASASPLLADRSVSVCAPTCLVADALTKVVLFGKGIADSVLARYNAEAFVVSAAALSLAA